MRCTAGRRQALEESVVHRVPLSTPAILIPPGRRYVASIVRLPPPSRPSTDMNPQLGPMPDLDTLIGLFYDAPEQLGQFDEAASSELPEPYAVLLDHNEHMTVTVESFHRSRVDVQVLETNITPTHYARKILLTRQSDGGVVQFGVVRLNMGYLSEPVQREIRSQQKPLGRILIEHHVLRQVELVGLWRVTCGPDLQKYFGLNGPTATYGRTALIHCNGEPAVELLEIVTPCTS